MGKQLKEKPNWQQWIPIYGIFRAFRDDYKGKSSIINSGFITSVVSVIYHGSCCVGIFVGLEKLLQ